MSRLHKNDEKSHCRRSTHQDAVEVSQFLGLESRLTALLVGNGIEFPDFDAYDNAYDAEHCPHNVEIDVEERGLAT